MSLEEVDGDESGIVPNCKESCYGSVSSPSPLCGCAEDWRSLLGPGVLHLHLPSALETVFEPSPTGWEEATLSQPWAVIPSVLDSSVLLKD